MFTTALRSLLLVLSLFGAKKHPVFCLITHANFFTCGHAHSLPPLRQLWFCDGCELGGGGGALYGGGLCVRGALRGVAASPSRGRLKRFMGTLKGFGGVLKDLGSA